MPGSGGPGSQAHRRIPSARWNLREGAGRTRSECSSSNDTETSAGNSKIKALTADNNRPKRDAVTDGRNANAISNKSNTLTVGNNRPKSAALIDNDRTKSYTLADGGNKGNAPTAGSPVAESSNLASGSSKSDVLTAGNDRPNGVAPSDGSNKSNPIADRRTTGNSLSKSGAAYDRRSRGDRSCKNDGAPYLPRRRVPQKATNAQAARPEKTARTKKMLLA